MMIKRLYILILALGVLSCNRMEPLAPTDDCLVSVSIDVDVESAEVVAKSVEESSVCNLWIIQYNGEDDGAVLLGDPVYIEDFGTFVAGNHMVKLVASSNTCTIVLLANTFENKEQFQISQGSTLIQLKQRFRTIASPDDIFSADGEGNRYPIFSDCVVVDGINEDTEITARLRRNLAKVSIEIRKNADDVSISSVQLCSVSDKSYYVTNFPELTDPFPADENLTVFDYDPVDWPDGETSLMLTTWLPANLRGTTSQNVSPAYKNLYAPEGATYLMVSGSYNDGTQDIPIFYKFYLGENMVDDFNMKPNGSYSYLFTIESKGDSDNDSRVEDWGPVDFTSPRYEPANCYMLNPGTVNRRFRIPIQRIFTFWGNDNYAYYEDDEYFSLRENDGKWRAFILQSDFDINDASFRLTKLSGTAGADTYFEVEVAPGIEGNVLIAVGPDDGKGQISWSWHLWITGYDPNAALDWGDGQDGRYVYSVRNGYVHRYSGTYWIRNGSQYIMDRNLGWTSDPHVYPDDNKGLLYYQFGRKDPFIYSDRISNVSYSVANEENGVLFSIHNPTAFIKSSDQDWTSGNKYNPTEYDKHIIWNDPLTVPGAQNEGRKSIFDPCPPGYRLPSNSVWTDFVYNSESQRTTNTFPDKDYDEGDIIEDSAYKGGFKPYNMIKGLQYWPFQGEGVLIPEFEQTVYIPASGFIEPATAMVRSHGNGNTDGTADTSGERWSFLWGEYPKSVTQGGGYTSQQDHLGKDNSTWRTRACPVRCITDK